MRPICQWSNVGLVIIASCVGENSGVAGKPTEGEREREKRRSRGGREEKRLAAEATSCGRRQGTENSFDIKYIICSFLKPKLNQGCRLTPPLVIAAILAEVEQLVLSCIYNTLLKL